ncbi:hypothetical protein ACFLVH_05500, partial [Chloroflexota bacterium]
MQPNFNFNFSTSIFVFIGAVAFSYYTHVGWWALAGLAYLLYSKFSDNAWVVRLSFLILSAILFLIA